MVCENCFGLISISIACFIICILLYRGYQQERNQFTLYMVLFFLIAGAGWLFWFLSTDLVLNIYEDVKNFLIFVGLIPQLILLIFVLTFYEISLLVRVSILMVTIILSIIHLIFPTLRILTIVSTVIIILNIILFIINWRKNQDLKSLLFSIGLALILLGEALISVSRLLQGIFLTLTAVIWIVTYSGIIEKLTKRE
ncbi:MAG: membrane protein of unknown function [Promethearchaeota archaeon]|nr:MAG: membrane protein of unknown function [Candidatus Lokiarchaeota archaeon]